MAEKQVVGRLVNTVSFQTDPGSLKKALADIQKVKDAMKGLTVPANAMKQQVAAKKQLVSQDKDWLVVQRAINKNKTKEEQREKSLLDSKAKGIKLTEKQTKANQRQQQIARKEAVARLTQGSGMKVNDMLFMRMSKQAEAYNKRRDDVLSRRDSQRLRRRINRSNSLESLHGQALGMNAAYDRRQARIHSRALAENAKRDRVASQNAAKVSARRMDIIKTDRFGLTSRFGAGAGRGFDSISNQFKSGAISARMYRQQVSALRRDLSSAANAQRGFNGTMKGMRSSFVQATASYTAFSGLMGIAETGKKYQGYESALTMGLGSPEKAAVMTDYLQKEIRRLGLDPQSATENFSKYSISAAKKLDDTQLKDFFTNFMEYASVAGAGKEKTSLGFRAIQQMLDKNQIMAEEFRSQMAEQITGSGDAFRVAASKMIGRELKDGEFEQMMQAGLFKPAELLPLVAVEFKKMVEDSGTLDKKLQQLEAVESRMKLSWEYFVRALYDKGVEAALKNLYKGIDRVANSVKQLAGNAIGKFLKGALDAISFVALNLLDVFQIVIYLIDQAFGKSSDIKSTTAEILGWVVAFAAMAKIASGIFKTMKFVAGLSATLGLGGAAKVGLIGKVLILGAEAAFFFGITNAIIDALGIRKKLEKIGGDIYSATHQTDINKPGYGQFTFDKITPFLSSDNIHNPTGSSIKVMQQQAMMASTPLWYQNAQNQPQNVNVTIKMDKNAKDFVKAEVQQNTQQQINSLIPPFLRAKH